MRARKLRRQATAFEADGRVRDAITSWTALNRLHPDAAIEERLVALRCDLDETTRGTGAPPSTTPAYADPFPDGAGRVPEIAAADLTTAMLGGAILHHGSLLVRGLVDAALVTALSATVDRAFDAREEQLEGAPRAATTPWYAPCEAWDARAAGAAAAARRWTRECSAVQVVDSPRALAQVVDAFEAADLTNVISAYLGEPIFLSVNKTTLRRVAPDATPAWHQDGSFMGPEVQAIDVWVALTRSGPGTDAPGIAIVPRRLDGLVPVGGEGAFLTSAVSVTELERAAGGATVSPTFEPGDALLFDQLALHATDGSKEEWKRPRYALEAWAFAASSFPEEYFPFLI